MEKLTEVITSYFHPQSLFSETISSISDDKFSQSGRYILPRGYLSLKIWGINMEKKPLRTMNIHDRLRSKLCGLYENDCIFDKFECTFRGDGNNNVQIYGQDGYNGINLQADKSAIKLKKLETSKETQIVVVETMTLLILIKRSFMPRGIHTIVRLRWLQQTTFLSLQKEGFNTAVSFERKSWKKLQELGQLS
ncbi:hypothetical protein K501DRAFT_269819 [Backusella circina FSU 941]|nr:hypothetical protein K501DRAFT_269819 [Backusella circina FSU 941]